MDASVAVEREVERGPVERGLVQAEAAAPDPARDSAWDAKVLGLRSLAKEQS